MLDPTTIDLRIVSVGAFEHGRGAVTLHTLLTYAGSMPSLIRITHGRISQLQRTRPSGLRTRCVLLLDRAYLDFKRLRRLRQSGAFFVTGRLKKTLSPASSRAP